MDNARLYEAEQRARAAPSRRTRRRASSSPRCRTSCARRSTPSAATRSCIDEGMRGPDHRRAAGRPRAHQAQPASSALAHQRHPRTSPSSRRGASSSTLEVRARCTSRSASSRRSSQPQLRQKRHRATSIAAATRSYVPVPIAERVQQILLNLLSNADQVHAGRRDASSWSATGDQGPHRSAGARHRASAFPPTSSEQIFEPFVQLDRGTSGRRTSGLGSVSRSVAISRVPWAAISKPGAYLAKDRPSFFPFPVLATDLDAALTSEAVYAAGL